MRDLRAEGVFSAPQFFDSEGTPLDVACAFQRDYKGVSRFRGSESSGLDGGQFPDQRPGVKTKAPIVLIKTRRYSIGP